MLKKLSSLVLGLVAVLTLAACTDEMGTVSGYYVAVDINPSIEFIVDEDENVESFIFLNEDAAILCAELDFTGMNIDDAIELFVQTATEAGYIDPEGEDNAVLITVLGEEDEEPNMEQVRERLQKRILSHFARNYINGVVLTDDFSQEDLVAEAESLGVSPGKLKLAYAAQYSDETLLLEDLLEMPVKDLMAMVRELHAEGWAEFKEEKRAEYQARLQERIERYEDRLEEFKANHPELTEDEINQIVEQRKAEIRENAQQRWEDRVTEWRNNHDQNTDDDSTNDDSTETENTDNEM